MEALEEEVARRRLGRSVPAPMSGQVTGTATSATAEPTTLLAAQAASSAAPQRMILLVGDTRVTCLESEALVLAAAAGAGVGAVAAPAALTGNPVTGFAQGEFNLHHI